MGLCDSKEGKDNNSYNNNIWIINQISKQTASNNLQAFKTYL